MFRYAFMSLMMALFTLLAATYEWLGISAEHAETLFLLFILVVTGCLAASMMRKHRRPGLYFRDLDWPQDG